jgi:hypothetical protein
MRPLLSVLAAARPVPMSHPLSRASHLRAGFSVYCGNRMDFPDRNPVLPRRRGGAEECRAVRFRCFSVAR